jgi:hypothetical protein
LVVAVEMLEEDKVAARLVENAGEGKYGVLNAELGAAPVVT